MPVVTGTAYWASVLTPNTNYEPVYTVNLVVPDDVAQGLQGAGLYH